MTVEDKTRGLYNKFNVKRLDGKDLPGCEKYPAEYLVLDIANDPYAREAARCYSFLCEKTHPLLAEDILEKLEEHAAKTKDHPNRRNVDDMVQAVLAAAENHHSYSETAGDAMGYNVEYHTKMREALERVAKELKALTV